MTRIVLLVALMGAVSGCGGGSSPTTPSPVVNNQITSTNQAQTGVVAVIGLGTSDTGLLEATLLIDGQEISGARQSCQTTNSGGCIGLSLTHPAPFAVSAGSHTLSVRVLRHTASGRASYFTTTGYIVVVRNGVGTQSISLQGRDASLAANESINFPFTFPS